jgi:hypothetical protein
MLMRDEGECPPKGTVCQNRTPPDYHHKVKSYMIQITKDNWTINRCEDSNKYMLTIDNQPLFSGNYASCLVVLGGLVAKNSPEFCMALVEEIESKYVKP